jgi:hypothetical protein
MIKIHFDYSMTPLRNKGFLFQITSFDRKFFS